MMCFMIHKFTKFESEKARKGSTLALKPMAYVTRSPKQGYQWPHQKDLGPSKLKKNPQIFVELKDTETDILTDYFR